MRAAAATAGMLSAAVLLSSGCGRGEDRGEKAEAEPVRWATFRVHAARDFLASCPGSADRIELVRAGERFEELKRFAAQKGAARALWLARNDYAGVARHGGREPCEPGEAAYREALAALDGALDELGDRIAVLPQ